ncbi:MAG: EpsG family protein [Mucilaginibacter sp.]|nr:EpsG family protein [Mucilaginibacter sp.]
MIYLLTLIMLAFFAFKYDFLKTHDGKPGLIEKGSYNVALISLIAIAGLRYKVGGDTFTYMESFEDIPFIWDFKNFDFSTATFDPLWFVFSSISKSIINDFVFFQILHAIFINVIIFKFFKKFTSFKFTAVLIYYLFLYEYFNMEIMRESLAICMLLLSYSFLETKKWYKYYLYALIGFLFHSSAIAMLILPLLYNRKFKLVPVLILSALLLIILLLPEEFKTIMSLALFNDRLSTRFFLYSEVSLNQNGVLLLAVVYILVPGLLILLSERYLIGKPVFRKMYFAYFCMAIIILGFSGFT